MNYKVTVDGKEIEYGALVEKSHFSDEEWSAIHDSGRIKKRVDRVF